MDFESTFGGSLREAAALIDHTELRPEAHADDIRRRVDEAIEGGFAAVCLHGGWLDLARRRLSGAGPRLAAVIDFPHGAGGLRAKRDAAAAAWDAGADELDIVFARGLFLAGEEVAAAAELEAVVKERPRGALVKVILETAALPPGAPRRRAAELAIEAGADFLKTSPGFGPGGATVEDVRLLRSVAGPDRGVKASGGIRDAASFAAMVAAGANRIGASAGLAILKELSHG